MLLRSVRTSLFLGALALLIAGCAPAATTASSAAAPSVRASTPAAPAPTATSVAASGAPAAAPASSNSSSSDTDRLVVVPGKSKANYRVREQLARLSFPSDAVGSTSAITGTIVGKTDGTIISSESKFVVDLSTLQSDQSMRDNFLRQNVLQTNQYPNATFVPTSATGLPATLPPAGKVSFKLTGNLTIRNVTKQVTWDATCQAQSSTAGTCSATTSFTFEDVGLQIPHVFTVLSIVDKITLEVNLDLQRVSS
jgi:polyisoprenoid-binding protein YceI